MSDRSPRVALVEDDEDLRLSTTQLLMLAGFTVDPFIAAEPALAAIRADYDGVVVTDVRMPGLSGIDLFRAMQARDESLPVIVMTGHGDVTMAVDCLKAGAWDFLTKPFDPDALVAAVTRAAVARRLALENRRLKALAQADEDVGLIGASPAIVRLREMIPLLAATDMDLFIEGETGTGKEMLARLIHRAGKRSRHRFLSLACAALPDALIETELFGGQGDAGIMAANRGTLFVDDVDRASPRFQARLAQLIETREVRPANAREPVPVDLRVIATAAAPETRATDAIAPGLFYRLAAVRLHVPPLRERREDVPLLFAHLAGLSAARLRRPVPGLTADARDHLAGHDWPGNVRELAHFADRFVLGLDAPPAARPTEVDEPLADRVAMFERDAIVAAVRSAGGDAGQAMRRLGLPRKTFYYKVQRHGIDLAALRRQM